MKPILLIIALVTLTAACSHKGNSRKWNLEEKISRQENKNLQEIRSDMKDILDHHPELAQGIKTQIAEHLDKFLQKQLALRARESQIIQLKLEKSMLEDTVENHRLRSELQKSLTEVYKQKGQNVFNLVRQIKLLTVPVKPHPSFYREFHLFMKEVP